MLFQTIAFFFLDIFQTIKTNTEIQVSEVICLGLGSITQWLTARQQVSFLIITVDYLNIERKNVKVFLNLYF